MFKSVALRLTLFYLAIIMALSISFSLVIYRISYLEISHSFPSFRILSQYGQFPGFDYDLYRTEQLATSYRDLRLDLLMLNLFMLAAGAIISYYLARRTLKPIEDAFTAQSRFTADASHELRTPLTAMQTSIEVGLRNPKLTLATSKELLGSTLDEVKKLSALANGLLKLTRSTDQAMPRLPVNLQEVAAEATAQLELAAENKSILIKNEVPKMVVVGDALSLKEVIAILLDNAIKYSDKGKQVTLKGQQLAKFASLSIVDKGVGIKASDLVHIFDRFYRADSARSRSTIEGYGLGLSIAKKIVEAHGGTIEATSTAGQGSTFTIKLPLE